MGRELNLYQFRRSEWLIAGGSLLTIQSIPFASNKQSDLLVRTGGQIQELWDCLIAARNRVGIDNDDPIPVFLSPHDRDLLTQVLLLCVQEFACDPISLHLHLCASTIDQVLDVLSVLGGGGELA